MDHRDLQIFLTIATTKNINKAANALFLAPTTVGTRLKALEDELGFTLFQRSKGYKSVQLTEKGNSFLLYARQWMELWNHVQLISGSPDISEFTISCSSSLLDFATNLYLGFIEDYPSIQLKINILDSDVAYSLVQQGKVDIGLVMYPNKINNVLTEELFKENLVLAYSRNYSVNTPVVSIHDFPMEHQILFIWNNGFEEWYSKHVPFYSGRLLRINSAQLLRTLFNPNSSWAIVPRSVAEMMRDKGVADFRPILENPPKRAVFLIVNEQKKDHPYIKEFRSKLLEHVHYYNMDI